MWLLLGDFGLPGLPCCLSAIEPGQARRGTLPGLYRFLSDVETGHVGSSTNFRGGGGGGGGGAVWISDSGNFPAPLALLIPYRPGGDTLGASTLFKRYWTTRCTLLSLYRPGGDTLGASSLLERCWDRAQWIFWNQYWCVWLIQSNFGLGLIWNKCELASGPRVN